MVAATYQERLDALRFALNGWGYAGAISESFPLWTPVPGSEVLRADLVAFTHVEQRDISTSAIVAQVIDAADDILRRWIPAAAALGAPAVLAALPDRLALWQTAPNPVEACEMESVPISAPATLVDRTAALSQDAIARAKASGIQPALFPLGIDVLNASRRSARSYLTEQVELALTRLAGSRDPARADVTARLVIGTLAILMIRDKAESAALADAGPGVLIDVAQQRFPSYFHWLDNLVSEDWHTVEVLIRNLGTNINFASLEPAMVSDVYEQALVTKLTRRRRGTFYTPPQLAQQMMNVIPFEHIEPSERHVLDPSCGSGTLLLAAANRLSRLQVDQARNSVHQYLISHLRGFDIDPLATEITKLCLLMNAMPIGNSWRISQTDTLSLELKPEERPTVIVSNPPWEWHPKGEHPEERANIFLSWMLNNLASNGFLACVLPLSWINKKNSRSSRLNVLANADLLDVWRLPSSIFHSTRTTIAPAVVVLQKHGLRQYRPRFTLIRTVRDDAAPSFLASGNASEAYLTEAGVAGTGLLRGPLSRDVGDRPDLTTLGYIADVYMGWPKQKDRPTRSVSDSSHYEMGSLNDLVPFGEAKLNTLRPVHYPEDYHHARRTDERVRAHKVIVTGKRFSTDDPWRISAGYDSYGVALREMFFAIVPDAGWDSWADLSEWHMMCCLMAVLGSGFGSCWIDENEPTRNLSIGCLKSLPVPRDIDRIAALAAVGARMAEAVSVSDPVRRSRAIQGQAAELESVVNEAYQLSVSARELIAQRLAGARARDGSIRYPAPLESHVHTLAGDPAETWEVPSFGHVLKVTEDNLVVWISGVTDYDGQAIGVPLQIPGWLCHAGADFTVSGDLSDPTDARFGFHLADWLTEEALTHRPVSNDEQHNG